MLKKINKDLAFLIIAVLFILTGLAGAYIEKANDGFTQADRAAKMVSDEINDSIKVHIKGAVKKEGVYSLTDGDRVADAINSAGGLSDSADVEKVNLARFIKDGEEIFIPTAGENFSVTKSGVVNINEADFETLKTIPGISDTLAQRIIDYRNENGKFGDTVEIKKVSGIGDKIYARIMPYITAQ